MVKPPASSASRAPPPLPGRDRPPPSLPEEPDVPMYRAKYNFQGQASELSLVKDDLVELVEKDDNGWWLVKKGTEEGWTPSNYLDLVPPKPKATPAPPPIARRPPAPPPAPPAPAAAPVVAPKPATVPTQQAKIQVQSLTANASAKPVSVFPGMGPSNGTAARPCPPSLWPRNYRGDPPSRLLRALRLRRLRHDRAQSSLVVQLLVR